MFTIHMLQPICFHIQTIEKPNSNDTLKKIDFNSLFTGRGEPLITCGEISQANCHMGGGYAILNNSQHTVSEFTVAEQSHEENKNRLSDLMFLFYLILLT